ncbi:hypothetical protein WKW80_26985 [Variovorax humicola]|uniref:Uncharacterized protein n=1 Tax=Variovorax humicola TaxID=1769758 RepID=A0ABU8W6R7_9BURK
MWDTNPSVFANLYTHLKLVDAQLKGEGKTQHVNAVSFDIIGWSLDGGPVVPITIRGILQPEEGHAYAVLNTVDKSHMSLDGTVYLNYAAFCDVARRAAEREGANRETMTRAGSRVELGDVPGPDPYTCGGEGRSTFLRDYAEPRRGLSGLASGTGKRTPGIGDPQPWK